VGAFGEAVLLDWGIAKVKGLADERGSEVPAHAEAGLTSHGSVLGTPACMAPEQARGEVARTGDLRRRAWPRQGAGLSAWRKFAWFSA